MKNDMRKYINIIMEAEQEPYHNDDCLGDESCRYPSNHELSKHGIFLRNACGDFIDRGIDRCVYEFNGEPDKVIKGAVTTGESHVGEDQNQNEAHIWSLVRRNKKLKPWFCPVLDISDHNMFMVMPFCYAASEADFPRAIPICLTNARLADARIDNYGTMPNGHLVLLDYGIMDEDALKHDRLVRIKIKDGKVCADEIDEDGYQVEFKYSR